MLSHHARARRGHLLLWGIEKDDRIKSGHDDKLNYVSPLTTLFMVGLRPDQPGFKLVHTTGSSVRRPMMESEDGCTAKYVATHSTSWLVMKLP